MSRGVTAAAMAAVFFALSAAGAAAGPLRTAIIDPGAFGDFSRHDVTFRRVARTGATMVRLQLVWRGVAPDGRVKPSGFDADNPRAPEYNESAWHQFDRQIVAARSYGLEPLVYIQSAPTWAENGSTGPEGTNRPDPVEFGRFARAVATRYSGSFVPNDDPYAEPLPRVRYWQAWNEPNRHYFLMPQYEGRQIASAGQYRAMVNRFAAAVHAVNPTNTVIAGGLAPLGRPLAPAPLAFMRAFLAAPVEFDVWSHHPYTSGGPTHRATNRDDVALGDLPDMRRVLRSAIRAGRVVSNGPVGFWVTEFSWDTSPPDPEAVGAALHARWVAEALYRMWRNGVSVVAWFRLQDDPLRATPYQSGFYTVGGRRKRSLTAFRFPTVAFAGRRGVLVWGRTPAGQPGRVVLEIKSGRRWRRLGTRRTTTGVFSARYRTPIRRGYVRARFGREASVPFSLTRVADRYVNPFGCGGGIRC